MLKANEKETAQQIEHLEEQPEEPLDEPLDHKMWFCSCCENWQSDTFEACVLCGYQMEFILDFGCNATNFLV